MVVISETEDQQINQLLQNADRNHVRIHNPKSKEGALQLRELSAQHSSVKKPEEMSQEMYDNTIRYLQFECLDKVYGEEINADMPTLGQFADELAWDKPALLSKIAGYVKRKVMVKGQHFLSDLPGNGLKLKADGTAYKRPSLNHPNFTQIHLTQSGRALLTPEAPNDVGAHYRNFMHEAGKVFYSMTRRMYALSERHAELESRRKNYRQQSVALVNKVLTAPTRDDGPSEEHVSQFGPKSAEGIVLTQNREFLRSALGCHKNETAIGKAIAHGFTNYDTKTKRGRDDRTRVTHIPKKIKGVVGQGLIAHGTPHCQIAAAFAESSQQQIISGNEDVINRLPEAERPKKMRELRQSCIAKFNRDRTFHIPGFTEEQNIKAFINCNNDIVPVPNTP